MLPALPTGSWQAPKAHRRQIRRARRSLHSSHRRRSPHLTRYPRRGGMQCRRAELSRVGGPRRRRFYDDAGLNAFPACRVIRAHPSIRGNKRIAAFYGLIPSTVGGIRPPGDAAGLLISSYLRSIKSPDLDRGRRFITEDLVLDLRPCEAPLASRSIRRSGLSSCL